MTISGKSGNINLLHQQATIQESYYQPVSSRFKHLCVWGYKKEQKTGLFLFRFLLFEITFIAAAQEFILIVIITIK